jgi:hypothetical protein
MYIKIKKRSSDNNMYIRVKKCNIPIIKNTEGLFIDKKFEKYIQQDVPLENLKYKIYFHLAEKYYQDLDLLNEMLKILDIISFHEAMRYSIKEKLI